MRYDVSVDEHEHDELVRDVFPIYAQNPRYSYRIFGFWAMGLGRQYLYGIKYVVASLFFFLLGAVGGTAKHSPLVVVLGAVCWLVGSVPGFVLLFVEHRRHPRAVLWLNIATMVLWPLLVVAFYLIGSRLAA